MKPNSSLTNEWMPLFTSFPFVDYVNNLGAENYFARWSPGWEFLLWEGRNLSEDRQTDEREKSVDQFFPSTHSPSLRNGLVPHFLACHTERLRKRQILSVCLSICLSLSSFLADVQKKFLSIYQLTKICLSVNLYVSTKNKFSKTFY